MEELSAASAAAALFLPEVYGLNELDTALAAWRSFRDARRFGLKPSTGDPMNPVQ